MGVALAADSLKELSTVASTPTYDRADLRGGIVHFGVGNFHRAHMAVYLDELFKYGEDIDWAIVGAGTRPADGAMRERLLAQDWLTTVVEQDSAATNVRIVGSMVDFLDPGDPQAIVERLTDPAIRIVSLTVTEGGYHLNPGSGRFNPNDPELVRDVRGFARPSTTFGMIVKALDLRRERGIAPFTVLSCDNIPSNGDTTRNTVLGIAAMVSTDLLVWLEQHLACPNGMVDRITPVTTDRERARLRDEFGISDRSPIFCEGFKQWVVEDHFSAGRPALEKVGVTLVEDVAPFELMKIRILNGGHAAVSYPAALLGMEYVHEGMRDPLIAAYFHRLQHREILPLVPTVPGVDLARYVEQVDARFGNNKMGDTNRRVCFDGSNRQPKYVLPTVLDGLRRDYPIAGLAMISALWCRYCAGTTEAGDTIEANDPNWARMQHAALAAQNDPASFVSMTEIFGEAAGFPRYVEAFSAALDSLWTSGVRATLRRYIES